VNDAFYSALLLEKTLMYLFLFSMFIIMGVNIRNHPLDCYSINAGSCNAQGLGIKKSGICVIFLLQGTLIALLGILLGVFSDYYLPIISKQSSAVQFVTKVFFG
jgi:ABC-type lipoprotein release transport system permease subunit